MKESIQRLNGFNFIFPPSDFRLAFLCARSASSVPAVVRSYFFVVAFEIEKASPSKGWP
jgi:hypothetical protein